MIISRTPFRVSFFGGGTDYPDWYREHGGAVLATTIDKYCYISVRELPPFFDHKFRRGLLDRRERQRDRRDQPSGGRARCWSRLNVEKGLEIHHDGDLPARSGLGSSSAFTVGLISAMHALAGRHIIEGCARQRGHPRRAVRCCREPVGLQDQISAAFGGFNHISFRQDGAYEVRPIILPRERLEALQDHLLLFFTGHLAPARPKSPRRSITNLSRHAASCTRCSRWSIEAIAILSSPTTDLVDFGRLLDESWPLQAPAFGSRVDADHRQSAMTPRRAQARSAASCSAPAAAVSCCCSSGPRIASASGGALGPIAVPFRFETSGCRIVLYQPDGL